MNKQQKQVNIDQNLNAYYTALENRPDGVSVADFNHTFLHSLLFEADPAGVTETAKGMMKLYETGRYQR